MSVASSDSVSNSANDSRHASAPVRAGAPQPAKGRSQRQGALVGAALAAPAVVGLVVFFIVPMIAALLIGFTDWGLLSSPEWVGLENYRQMAADPLIWRSLQVTLVYTVLAVPTGVVGALAMALLLNQARRWNRMWVVLFYLPSILPAVATITVWRWLLDGNFGVVNAFLNRFGIESIDFFGDPNMVLPSFAVMNLWAAGGTALIFLAARRGVPTDLYEAASLDGAGSWQQFLRITLPMLSPVIMFAFVMSMIGALQTFTQGFLLGGGQGRSALFFNLYLYQQAFQNGRMGYASAMAMVLFVMTLILTALTFRSSALWVFYEGKKK